MALLPAIFILPGVFIFWRVNNLNPVKIKELKKELKERRL